ncbi:MAG: hypothetical protein OXC40_04215 [Proteobacteria bacterium]|nr:hypothetical protein [Pseudomonadota bacterium]
MGFSISAVIPTLLNMVLLIFCANSVIGCKTNFFGDNERSPESELKLINSKLLSHPPGWFVNIFDDYSIVLNKALCGGAYIASGVILTANHCLYLYQEHFDSDLQKGGDVSILFLHESRRIDVPVITVKPVGSGSDISLLYFDQSLLDQKLLEYQLSAIPTLPLWRKPIRSKLVRLPKILQIFPAIPGQPERVFPFEGILSVYGTGQVKLTGGTKYDPGLKFERIGGIQGRDRFSMDIEIYRTSLQRLTKEVYLDMIKDILVSEKTVNYYYQVIISENRRVALSIDEMRLELMKVAQHIYYETMFKNDGSKQDKKRFAYHKFLSLTLPYPVGSCVGDSGAPITFKYQGEEYLLGILSSGWRSREFLENNLLGMKPGRRAGVSGLDLARSHIHCTNILHFPYIPNFLTEISAQSSE